MQFAKVAQDKAFAREYKGLQTMIVFKNMLLMWLSPIKMSKRRKKLVSIVHYI